MTAEQIYEQHIKTLPISERLELVTLIARSLAVALDSEQPPKRSLLELEGLGADIWAGADAQQYVNDLRSEWEHRP